MAGALCLTVFGDWPRMITHSFVVRLSCPLNAKLFGTLVTWLCELAEAELMPLVEHGLLVELVAQLTARHCSKLGGLRIPVLRRVDTGAELGWPFDAEQVVAFLR